MQIFLDNELEHYSIDLARKYWFTKYLRNFWSFLAKFGKHFFWQTPKKSNNLPDYKTYLIIRYVKLMFYNLTLPGNCGVVKLQLSNCV